MNIRYAKYRKLDLSCFFKALISDSDSVPQENITPTWIHEQREIRVYPTMRFTVSSEHGGYSTAGLRVYTGNDIAATVSAAGYDF